jgi:hypothetical protein
MSKNPAHDLFPKTDAGFQEETNIHKINGNMVDAGASASGDNKQATGATTQKEPPLPRSEYAAAADAQQNQKNEDEANSGVRVSPVRTRRASRSLRRSSDRSSAPSPTAAEDARNTSKKVDSRDRRVDKARSKKSIVCVWSVWQPRPKISAFANQDHHRVAGQGLSVGGREKLRDAYLLCLLQAKACARIWRTPSLCAR